MKDSMPVKKLLFLISFFVLSIAGCDKDQHNHPELHTGQEYYNYHCAACHKENGSGTFLKGTPSNITKKSSLAAIILQIKNTEQHKQSEMPVFRNMPENEAYLIATYLLKLKAEYKNNPGNRNSIIFERKK